MAVIIDGEDLTSEITAISTALFSCAANFIKIYDLCFHSQIIP